jgi:hypothetical protein
MPCLSYFTDEDYCLSARTMEESLKTVMKPQIRENCPFLFLIVRNCPFFGGASVELDEIIPT